MGQLQEIWRYRNMLKYLVSTDLRARYKGSVLGFLWTFANPLLLIVIYSIVFSTILKVDIPNYTVYLIAGLLPWQMFQTTLVSSSGAIIRNSNLVKKIYFPRQVLPLSIVLANTINYLNSIVIVLLTIFLFHSELSWSVVMFPVLLLIEFILAAGFALLFSALNVYFRDVEHILTICMMAWFYLTPVVYSMSKIPEELRSWFYLNPMTTVIEGYVDIFYRASWPNWQHLTISLCWALGTFALGWTVFQKLNRGFGEEV